jgi:Zn-finger nucleic acid-binding protein
MHCPRCEIELTRVAQGAAVHFNCTDCGGAALLEEDLLAAAGAERVGKLFERLAAAGTDTGCVCPRCREAALEFTVDGRLRWLRLDGCITCRLIWFDGGELADFARQRAAQPRIGVDRPVHKAAEDMPRETTSDWLADGTAQALEWLITIWRWS